MRSPAQEYVQDRLQQPCSSRAPMTGQQAVANAPAKTVDPASGAEPEGLLKAYGTLLISRRSWHMQACCSSQRPGSPKAEMVQA